MNIFGWKSAGRASARPAQRHIPLTRGFGARHIGEWPMNYEVQVREGYLNNAVAQRAVRLVAEGVASVPLTASDAAALALVKATSGGQALLETLATQMLLHGNGYVQLLSARDGSLSELYALRPERVSVEADVRGWPAAFRYKAGEAVTRLGANEMIHIRTHHPLDDHYGLGCLGAASGAIAIHNASARWNKALLDNAARPSGALVHEAAEALSGEQFDRLKEELTAQFSGQANAGRPMLLEGGLKWQTLSLSPADMDFAGLKAAAAREIALAFGVPPMLLGLPGDATYANYREANKALWRSAILPLAGKILHALAEGLRPWFPDLALSIDANQVTALSEDRERLWAQVAAADFLTLEEKRAAVGMEPVTDVHSPKNEPENITGIFEQKFNPWHDAEDGKFTFAGRGKHSGYGGYGNGQSGGGGASGSWEEPVVKPKPKAISKPKPKPKFSLPRKTQPAATADNIVAKTEVAPEPSSRGPSGGGKLKPDTSRDFDGTGIIVDAAATAVVAAAAAAATAATAIGARIALGLRTINLNGYKYHVDPIRRPHEIDAELRMDPLQTRSRRAQNEAGGPDRRPTDEGGHFIAREFGGSKDPINHFAQDAKFNRGLYRQMENAWKKELSRAQKVKVHIKVKYKGLSRRPESLHVTYRVGGKKRIRNFNNSSKGISNGS
jgi:HK97 family phage portal protein